ncbi:MAG TPA: TIGR04076 family protein [Thermoanaerobacterales bacterium]|nr:TIGR04076 family protein [Thermoanaerobacterales bacterium]
MQPVKRVVDVTRDVVVIAREVKGKCAAHIKPGDKIVIEGANISLEKSDNVCGYALSNIMPVIFAVRLGVDLDKLGLKGRLWQCVDPGPPYTEGGTVLFEVLPMGKIKNG